MAINGTRIIGALAIAFALAAAAVYWLSEYYRWPAFPLGLTALLTGATAVWWGERHSEVGGIPPDSPEFRHRFRGANIRAVELAVSGAVILLFIATVTFKLSHILSATFTVATLIIAGLLMLIGLFVALIGLLLWAMLPRLIVGVRGAGGTLQIKHLLMNTDLSIVDLQASRIVDEQGRTRGIRIIDGRRSWFLPATWIWPSDQKFLDSMGAWLEARGAIVTTERQTDQRNCWAPGQVLAFEIAWTIGGLFGGLIISRILFF